LLYDELGSSQSFLLFVEIERYKSRSYSNFVTTQVTLFPYFIKRPTMSSASDHTFYLNHWKHTYGVCLESKPYLQTYYTIHIDDNWYLRLGLLFCCLCLLFSHEPRKFLSCQNQQMR